MTEAESHVGEFVTLRRGKTYKGLLVGEPGPALLGLGSIKPGGGFRPDYKTYGGDCPPDLMIHSGDLYVSLKGATKDGEMIGSVARVPKNVPKGRLTQDTVALDFIEPNLDFERYLYWVLRTPSYRAYCAGRATGSAVSGLSRGDFLSFAFPPMNSQRVRLAKLLDDLDDKIESNRRVVDAIPSLIRAKVDEALADSGEEIAVARLANFVNGGAYTKDATGSGRMVIRIADLNSGPGRSTVYNELEIPEDKTAWPGDILMSWSGSLGVYRWARNEAIVNQHIFKVIPAGYPAWLTFDRLEYVNKVFQGIAKDKATTMGHIQRSHLETTAVAIPTGSVIDQLDSALSPLWERHLVAAQEIFALERLRDALLPELLSDRIRVPEAQEAVA